MLPVLIPYLSLSFLSLSLSLSSTAPLSLSHPCSLPNLNMLLPSALLGISVLATTAYGHPQPQTAGRLGAVASESKECSKIGVDILKAGGNAADAIVATQFCVGVVGM